MGLEEYFPNNELKLPCNSVEVPLSDGAAVQGHGHLAQTALGRVTLELVVPIDDLQLEAVASSRELRGVGPDGSVVLAEKCSASAVGWDPPNSRSAIRFDFEKVTLSSTTLSHSVSPTEIRVYVKGAKLPFPVSVQMGNDAFELRQISNAPFEGVRGAVATLLTLEVRDSAEETKRSVGQILAVLSAAQRCQLFVSRRETWAGDRLVDAVLYPMDIDLVPTHPVIPWTANEMRSYLEQVLPAYRAKSGDYALERLIWHYCNSFSQPFIVAKFFFGSVFMEAFKFWWAKNVGRVEAELNADGLVSGFVRRRRANGSAIFYKFKELLTMASQHIGYQGDFTFIDNRNALFHSGATTATQLGENRIWPRLKPELHKLYREMDDILLRLLEYTGPVHPYEEPDAVESFPERARQ